MTLPEDATTRFSIRPRRINRLPEPAIRLSGVVHPTDSASVEKRKTAGRRSFRSWAEDGQLKSLGLRSTRLHVSHSATFFTLPSSNRVFIFTSPPHGQ